MVKDYVLDLEPSSDDEESVEVPIRKNTNDASVGSERSIRNITMQRRTPSPHRSIDDTRLDRVATASSGRRPSSRILWVIAAIAVIAVAGVAALIFFGSTSVDVTPRTHRITFDESTQFAAYPQASAATGTIAYAVETHTLEDSATVPAQGTEHGEDRASGNITIYNNYSAKSVRLIKNTRFESPGGLIYRIPASVDIPPKNASTPGQITVTVIADAAGENYNLDPTDRFAIPGLKGTADMYANVYARSSEKFIGGFIGERPVVTTQALEAARAEVRGRLTDQAHTLAAQSNSDTAFVFPDLVKITFDSLPTTSEAAGNARIHERATISMPMMNKQAFANSIAQAVRADADENSISLQPGEVFTARPVGTFPDTVGSSPITFSLSGTATLVWNVDSNLLKESLAGRDQGAFEAIVGAFPGVDKAEAHIAPLWSRSFPKNAADITITILKPAI